MPLTFDTINTLERARFETLGFEADILLQGAQLMNFTPRGQDPWIFASTQTPYAPGNEIYGGVPVVFPWFVRLPERPDAPNHGWARQAKWIVQSLSETQNGATVSFGLTSEYVRDEGFDVALWPHDFNAQLTFRLGETLGMRLEIENRNDSPVRFECALHTYFAVSNVRQVRVEGFVDERFKAEKGGEFQFQNGEITFDEAVNRIYARGGARIHDADRTFVLTENEGWRSTIVWNPGKPIDEQAPDDWKHFVCVEAGAIDDQAVTLAPNETYALDIEIALA